MSYNYIHDSIVTFMSFSDRFLYVLSHVELFPALPGPSLISFIYGTVVTLQNGGDKA